MSSEKAFSATAALPEAYTDPGFLPEVSFDIRLGKKFEHVAFNYDQYKEMVLAQGGSVEDYEDAIIRVVKPKFYETRYGYYSTDNDTITINARHSEHADVVLAHETQHYLDDQQEMYEQKNFARRVFNNAPRIYRIGAATAGFSVSVASSSLFFDYHPLGETVFRINPLVAIGGTALTFIGRRLYKKDPLEIRARVAEENAIEREVLTLTSKD